jgi:phage shock protein PspC (stress-responsive transcriptional regulator)
VLYAGAAFLVAWFLLLRADAGNAIQLTAINGLGALLIMSAVAYRTRHTAGDADDVDFLTFLHGIYKLEEGHEFQLFGVCTGLGAACRIPVFVWRILFIAWTCMGAGGVAVYAVLYMTLPAGKVSDREDNEDDEQDDDAELAVKKDPPPPVEVDPPRPDADTVTPQLSEKTRNRLKELKKGAEDDGAAEGKKPEVNHDE